MATSSYDTALQAAIALTREEQMRLIEALQSEKTHPEPQHSIMELCGLGREIWEGIDAQKYVDEERASWNG